MGKKIIFFLGGCLIFIALHCFSRFIYNQSWFGETSLDTQVNPFDIITLIINSGLTVWLGIYIAKKLTEQRYQKEYLMDDLKKIENYVYDIDKAIEISSTISLDQLLDHCNKIKVSISRFEQTLNIFNISDYNTIALNSQFVNLYSEITNLPGNTLIINGVNRITISNHCTNVVTQTRLLIFMVNKN